MVKRVLLVDDNPVVVKTLRELFTHESDFEVCGELRMDETRLRRRSS